MQAVFEYTEEAVNSLVRFLSEGRLEKYVERFGHDKVECLQLYAYNAAISESLYTPLQGLEVCLRNALDIQLVNSFGPNWHLDKNQILEYPLTEMIDKAYAEIRKEKSAPTRGDIVAELNFGFWAGALGPRYDDPLWRQTTRHAFPHRPKGFKRADVHGAINAIRRLRNRVMHHEPILHRDLESDHETIMLAISWICPATVQWIRSQSRFHSVFRSDHLPAVSASTVHHATALSSENSN